MHSMGAGAVGCGLAALVPPLTAWRLHLSASCVRWGLFIAIAGVIAVVYVASYRHGRRLVEDVGEGIMHDALAREAVNSRKANVEAVDEIPTAYVVR
jgi:hypothetical protein